MPLSEFQRIFHGFEHAGLRLEIDPRRSDRDHIAGCLIIDVETGESVGDVLRWLEERDGRLVMRAEGQFLLKPYRRRGFSRALLAYGLPRYRELGITATSIRADDDGGAVWARMGFDFDLSRVEGPDAARRRARAVAKIFSPDAPRRRRWRRVPRWLGPNPHGVLRGRERRGGAGARAAREMRARIPTEERIASGDLEGTFTSPAEIVAFVAHGVKLGEETMRRAEWDGIMSWSE